MIGKTSEASPGRRGILFVVSAPSGGGKTTLVNAALKKDRTLSLSVSYTTRKPRAGEREGRDYFFVGAAQFRKRRLAGEFVEWAEVFDHAYATPRAPLDSAISAGRDVLLDVDIQGARSIKRAYPADAVAIFIVPPSFRELERRLRARGTDSGPQIERRLARAREEISAARDKATYDYVIINHDKQRATRDLLAIINGERCRLQRITVPLAS